MSAPFRYGITILASYFVAWTVAYSIVTYNAVGRLDFSQYFTWLFLSWNFTGFEWSQSLGCSASPSSFPSSSSRSSGCEGAREASTPLNSQQTAVSSGAESAAGPSSP
jgi:hypothetical protein